MRLMRQSGSVRDRVREVNWNLVVEQAMKFGAANVLGVCSTRRRKWGLPSAVCRATRPSRLCLVATARLGDTVLSTLGRLHHHIAYRHFCTTVQA